MSARSEGPRSRESPCDTSAHPSRVRRVSQNAGCGGWSAYQEVAAFEKSARTERVLVEVAADSPTVDEPWDAHLDGLRTLEVLDDLGAHHRTALTLRYVDGLPVRDVALALGRTEHATEALLVRARRAFRQAYEDGEGVA